MISFDQNVSCDFENKTRLMGINVNCQLIILEQLGFETLVNVSQVNVHLYYLVGDVLRIKNFKSQSCYYQPQYKKWSFLSVVLCTNHDIPEGILKRIGLTVSIKKLGIFLYQLEKNDRKNWNIL